MAMMAAQTRKCPKCRGYGWWPIGDLCPIGEMDSHEWGNKIIQCPWCGNPPNGDNKSERYKALVKAKEKEENATKNKI